MKARVTKATLPKLVFRRAHQSIAFFASNQPAESVRQPQTPAVEIEAGRERDRVSKAIDGPCAIVSGEVNDGEHPTRVQVAHGALREPALELGSEPSRDFDPSLDP